MKTVGSRKLPQLALKPSGVLLAEGARFSESLSHLSPSTFMPKGVWRFRSHAEANQHRDDCLVQGMAALAQQRANDKKKRDD